MRSFHPRRPIAIQDLPVFSFGSNLFADTLVRPPDRILVIASPVRALDLLRWATLRSDDVLFVAQAIENAAWHFASRYAVEMRQRAVEDADYVGISALLLSLDDQDAENAVIRRARRRGIAIHVHDRPLVSDFTVLAMMEQTWPLRFAA